MDGTPSRISSLTFLITKPIRSPFEDKVCRLSDHQNPAIHNLVLESISSSLRARKLNADRDHLTIPYRLR